MRHAWYTQQTTGYSKDPTLYPFDLTGVTGSLGPKQSRHILGLVVLNHNKMT